MAPCMKHFGLLLVLILLVDLAMIYNAAGKFPEEDTVTIPRTTDSKSLARITTIPKEQRQWGRLPDSPAMMNSTTSVAEVVGDLAAFACRRQRQQSQHEGGGPPVVVTSSSGCTTGPAHKAVKAFCQDWTDECQQTRHDWYRDIKIDNASSTTTSQYSGSGCKTLWINGMSEGFSKSGGFKIASATGGEWYKQQYVAALRSAQQHAKSSLQPVLILIHGNTTTTTGSMGSNNNNGSATNAGRIMSPFGEWAQSQGVIVIRIERLSFQELVYSRLPAYAEDGRIGYYIRLDIPRILTEHRIFSNIPNICDRHVMYTDSDVLFLKPLLTGHIERLTRDMQGKALMFGQDLIVNRRRPSNTGVMLIDVPAFAKLWPAILHFGEKQTDFPEHDQIWLNRFFVRPTLWKLHTKLLPTYWNWKIYWKLEPNNFSDLQIVHFQGPKPGMGLDDIATCNLNTMTRKDLDDGYFEMIKHAFCCDQGKTAAAMLDEYNCWISSSELILSPMMESSRPVKSVP